MKKGLEAATKAVHNATEFQWPVSGSLRAQRWAIGDLSESGRRLSFDMSKNEVYRRHGFLRDHAEFLGDLKPSDIMGAGNNAIVVRHPKIEGRVVKIPYPGEVDSVTKEIRNHERAFLALKNGISEGKVSENIKIPRVFSDIPDTKNVFSMQHVTGQNLHTKMLLEFPEYKNTVDKLSKTRDISKMTDNEVYRYIADNHPFWAEYLDMVIKGPKSAEYAKAYIDSHPEIRKALDHLDAEKIGHADMHGWNIMLGRDWNTYLIDFGRVSSPPSPQAIPSSIKSLHFMRPTVQFWQEYGFGNVEFRNIRLLDSGIYCVLECLQSQEKSNVTWDSWRTLIHVWESVFLVRYDDTTGFETAKNDFPHDTVILSDGSILPRYFGEFEKDGTKYIVVDCEERLAPSDGEWIAGTYRNMVYDLRGGPERAVHTTKWSIGAVLGKK